MSLENTYWADTLSRAYIGNDDGEFEEDDIMVHTVQVSEDKKMALRTAYSNDATMNELKRSLVLGVKSCCAHRTPPLLECQQ